MKKGDNTQENVGGEKDTQQLVSDTVAATLDGNNDANAKAHPPVSTTVIDIPLIEDFEADSHSTDEDSAIEDIHNEYKDGKYLLPNDESEQNRLDLQHHLSLLTLHGELHLAPIKPDLHHALDIGTGTGIWAIDFAIKHPSCHVLGCDLSPIQPQHVPPNCHFEVDDVEEEWQYNHKFDYIHGRFLALCFKDTATVFKNAFDALSPGGYFEMQDALTLTCVDSSGEGTQLMRWVGLMLEVATKLGRDWAKVTKYKSWMEEAGFVDVKETNFAWPTNTWPRGRHYKTLGVWAGADLKDGLEGFSMAALTKALGWKSEEVKALLADVRRDLDDRNIHAYLPILVVYGRKPQ